MTENRIVIALAPIASDCTERSAWREYSAAEYRDLPNERIEATQHCATWLVEPDGTEHLIPAREAHWLRSGARARHSVSGAWPVPA